MGETDSREGIFAEHVRTSGERDPMLMACNLVDSIDSAVNPPFLSGR